MLFENKLFQSSRYIYIKAMEKMLLKRKPACSGEVMESKRLEIRDRAYELCKEFLQGQWALTQKSDFQLTVLGGGLTNKLYICQIPNHNKHNTNENEPCKVLLRMYGLIIQDFAAQIQESVVFSILAERKIGPRLHAVFPGGRLEEYLPCRTLETCDLSVDKISQQIAKRMSSFHTLVMPVKKEPTYIMEKLNLYFESIQHFDFEDENKSALFEEFCRLNLDKELNYVKQLVLDTDSPVMFCHNDVQEGNLLYTEDEHNPVQMIDFEYSSYNYRGFDLGNHFCEWMFDYSYQKWPCFSYKLENYPTRQQQETFIQSYIDNYFANSKNPEHSRQDEKWQMEFMIKEANRFALLSHLFWAMWSIVQAKMSDIGFGYLEYALARMKAYLHQKEYFD